VFPEQIKKEPLGKLGFWLKFLFYRMQPFATV